MVARASSEGGNKALLQKFLNCMEEDPQDFVESTTMKNLASAFLQDPSNTGLERMAARAIYREKNNRREMMWEKVKQIQDCRRMAGFNEQIESEMLRMGCEKISQASVRFAHCIGTC